MNIQQILDTVKSKYVKPRVYAIVGKCKQGSFLMLETAHDMETAYSQGKLKFQKQNPHWNMSEVKVDMFTHAEFADLLKDLTDIPFDFVPQASPPPPVVQVVQGVEDKNSLMARIVKEKNGGLLEEQKSLFSEAEYKYLSDKIKSKK